MVDVQYGLDDPGYGRRNNPGAEANIARLLAGWRESNRPIFHIQHLSTREDSPLAPGGPGVEIKAEAKPLWHEPVITKRVNCAFVGTDLEARLRQRGIATLLICGLTTNHCVDATTRMAGDLGFTTYLAGDAAATFDRVGPDGVLYPAEQIHGVCLASLQDEFATVVTTDEALSALAASR